MFKITSKIVNEENSTLTLRIKMPQPFTDDCWVVRMSPEEVQAELDNMDIKRGKWHNPRTIGNRPPQYVLEYDLVFDLPRKRVQKKVTKKVDNSEKTVTLKKTRTKKTNTTGG